MMEALRLVALIIMLPKTVIVRLMFLSLVSIYGGETKNFTSSDFIAPYSKASGLYMCQGTSCGEDNPAFLNLGFSSRLNDTGGSTNLSFADSGFYYGPYANRRTIGSVTSTDVPFEFNSGQGTRAISF